PDHSTGADHQHPGARVGRPQGPHLSEGKRSESCSLPAPFDRSSSRLGREFLPPQTLCLPSNTIQPRSTAWSTAPCLVASPMTVRQRSGPRCLVEHLDELAGLLIDFGGHCASHYLPLRASLRPSSVNAPMVFPWTITHPCSTA